MILNVIFINLFLLLLTLWLLFRYRQLETTFQKYTQTKCNYSHIQQSLRTLFHTFPSLSTFVELPINFQINSPLQYCDPDDTYYTTKEALDWLIQQPEPQSPSELKRIIKAHYQIQQSLDLPIFNAEKAIQKFHGLIHSLMASHANKTTIITVKPGQVVELDHMQPINEGSIVKQPLGVIVTADGKTISKARVLCG